HRPVPTPKLVEKFHYSAQYSSGAVVSKVLWPVASQPNALLITETSQTINQFGDRSWKKNAPNRLGSATARHYLASPTGRMRLRRRNPPKCFGTRTETKGVFPLPLHMFSFSLLLLLLLPCRPYAAQLPVNKQARTNFFADKRHGVCVETQNARPREPQHAPQ
ncbi:unnamed protein product, partial [Ectocarpus fasciculatus]